jgi:hypothetical protein
LQGNARKQTKWHWGLAPTLAHFCFNYIRNCYFLYTLFSAYRYSNFMSTLFGSIHVFTFVIVVTLCLLSYLSFHCSIYRSICYLTHTFGHRSTDL